MIEDVSSPGHKLATKGRMEKGASRENTGQKAGILKDVDKT